MTTVQNVCYSYTDYASSSGSASPSEIYYSSIHTPESYTTNQGSPSEYNATQVYGHVPNHTTIYPPSLPPNAFPMQATLDAQYLRTSQYQKTNDITPPPQDSKSFRHTDSISTQYPAPNSRPHSRPHESKPRFDIAHPYARLYAKKEEKRRRIWNHALEKALFTPYELSTIGAQQRRATYMSSLEAHIDQLHAQLLSVGFWPVEFEKLDPFKGLNSKTAKSMVAGLQHDASVANLKLLELERSNNGLRKALGPGGSWPCLD